MTDRPLARSPIRWAEFDAVLFDLDGVLTPTADVHERAWKEMFDAFLAGSGAAAGRNEPAFSGDDYVQFVDGKARFDGVRSFLASRDIVLPDGDITDPPGDATVCGLGNRKNQLFGEVLARDGMQAYPGSLRLLDLLAGFGTHVAVVSSSRNAPDVLRAAGLHHRFGVVIDGNVASAQHMAGKPAPDMYLAAAAQLGVAPDRAAVVEDALSGVAAGHAARFALVLGVNRSAGAEALHAHGADVVVDDLADTLPAADEPPNGTEMPS